jgi:hypothetical protein
MYDARDDRDLEAFSDEWTINRLLAGDLGPDDAPAELSGLAALVDALTATPQPAELAQMDSVLSAATAARHELEARRRARVRRHHVAIAAALSTLGVLVLCSGLAVANVLPTPAQRFASDVLAHVGVHVSHRDNATPASNISTNDTGTAVSGIARTPSTGPGKGTAVSGTASNGQSRAATPSTTPPASSPPGAAPTIPPHPGAPSARPPTSPPTSRPPPTGVPAAPVTTNAAHRP